MSLYLTVTRPHTSGFVTLIFIKHTPYGIKKAGATLAAPALK
ncbi:hypothetical protein AcetOrient_orf02938 [Acetobacter orientalis]|uniref:Uncharacterized protein n=1 Tax=Acetobacter orientalis TaxID=146474 RepID=A0A2Z5ZJN2_9PROT|nr:hypothetical protein AcetOrient_orf02938 [Acetobacter orientalis]